MILIEFHERLVLSKYGKKAGPGGQKDFCSQKDKKDLFKRI